jgi:dTDP-4-dehydrorhamnose reductase
MLASMIIKVLSEDPALNVTIIDRNFINARTADIPEIGQALSKVQPKWIINSIGIIKPKIKFTEEAIQVNSLFPYRLNEIAKVTNAKVIQIATDCVYSGRNGNYVESDSHDALDVYGKTKSLGEVEANNFYNLRCSIIGPEQKSHLSLMDWLLGQPNSAEVDGYINHYWNGITNYQFAKICQGIIKHNIELPNVQHIVPANSITKAELLKIISHLFDRKDITINDIESPTNVYRTLSTDDWSMNEKLWDNAGYINIPTVGEMVKELAEYTK